MLIRTIGHNVNRVTTELSTMMTASLGRLLGELTPMYPDWKEKQDNILDDADLVKNMVTNPQYGHIAEKILQVETFIEKVNTAQPDNSYVLVSKEVPNFFLALLFSIALLLFLSFVSVYFLLLVFV